MKMQLDNRSEERRGTQRRRVLTSGQKVHLGWMLSEERRKGERRAAERRTD
jgi:hypothetical protein